MCDTNSYDFVTGGPDLHSTSIDFNARQNQTVIYIIQVIASIPYDWSPWRLLGCTLGRVILIPLMLACAAPRGDPYLHHEGWSMVLSAALGLSNGYFGSVPMILAPARVPDEQKEITGMNNLCWKFIDYFFSCDRAAPRKACLSVCLSGRPSVCPSHLFHSVPRFVSSSHS